MGDAIRYTGRNREDVLACLRTWFGQPDAPSDWVDEMSDGCLLIMTDDGAFVPVGHTIHYRNGELAVYP